MKKNKNTDFSLENVGQTIEIHGWIQRKRDLGGLIFIDLRDRSGIIQLVINPESSCYEVGRSLKSEYVIKARGEVVKRDKANPNLKTGEIEVNIEELEILNKSEEVPFQIEDDTTALEDTRLKYRYLDLRRNIMQKNLIIRHKIMMATREFLDKEGFLEIETPILCKSTPEGARDFLVPSRISSGKFYALPQSPQLFKQLLMVGGMEKYFQIAKCFRDEDLRSDRQPEFTQIDMEMSFVDENDVMDTTEKLISHIFKKVKNIDIKLPLLKMRYDDAIRDYGSDKPDIRFDMKIKDLTEIFKKTEFNLFQDIISNGGVINGIVVKGEAENYSRKKLDKLTEVVKTYKANGLFNLKFTNEITGSIKKNVTDSEIEQIKEICNIEENDLLLIVAGDYKIVKTSLGALRNYLAEELSLYKNNEYALLWIVDFPSFEYSEEEGRFISCHHPFTAPLDSDVDKLINDKEHCYSKAYDIVINGYEAGGGSIRIHDSAVQKKMFDALELTEDDIEEKFGFFVNALKYGTPPHGGLAFGLDRLTMLLAETENIKDVIAFPKTASAKDLMSDSPSIVLDEQLEDLSIKLDA